MGRASNLTAKADFFNGVVGLKRGSKNGLHSSQSDISLLLSFGGKEEALRRIALLRWWFKSNSTPMIKPFYLPRVLVDCKLYGRYPKSEDGINFKKDIEALEARGILQKAEGRAMYRLLPLDKWSASDQAAYKVW